MPNKTELQNILLSNRGIINKEKFLNPSYEEHLYNPYLLKDMEKAVIRIYEAIEAKEKIVIYTDYDCDGIPSAVIMNDFFKEINYKNFSIYIPDRHEEGYGLHPEAITKFINDKVNLLITFDLGITAIKEVIQAKVGGIDTIIVDHHLPSLKGTPQAYAVIDPKQNGCNYPDKMLCGAGLAFKLIQAFIKKYGEYFKIKNGWEKWLLDMVGIATLSDQVPLVDENRVLAYYGLKVLRKTRRPGLIEIFRKAGVNISKLNEEDVTFILAPRINAASRMANPMSAFELLSTNDVVKAKTLADYLVKINNERKYLVAQIMKDVKKNLTKRNLNEEEKPIIVIGNPRWRVGILGIVAAKITEEYKKPVFVWGSDGNGTLRGSCRSYGNINLVELMASLPKGSLEEFGGHKSAGGFSVSRLEVHLLEERLVSVFENKKNNLSAEDKILSDDDSSEEQLIDATIDIDDVNNENYQVIKRLSPFGVANSKPTFIIKDVSIFSFKEFGKEKNHLEVVFKNSHNSSIKAIVFFKTNKSFNDVLSIGKKIDLIVNFEENTFAGKTELRLRIVDII